VCAEDITFKQPKFPCAFQMRITEYEEKKEVFAHDIEFNGRYFKLTRNGDFAALLRPDIGGEDKLAAFTPKGKDCDYGEVGMDVLKYVIDSYSEGFFLTVNAKKWEHKKTETWRGKECTHYYDDDKDHESIYVYDDHIYGIVHQEEDIVFEYTWEAPMDDFTMSKKDFPLCVEREKRVAEVPSEDYVFCAAASVKIAFVAVLAALISALL